MFLEFKKITTSHPSRHTPIIINADALLTLAVDTFENKETRELYDATRVEIIGYPKYTFFTMTPFDDLVNLLKATDVTSGFVPGSSCGGGNTVDVVYPFAKFPLIRANAIFNNTLSETDGYVFNPNHMLYAEDVIFNDSVLQSQQTGLMIVLRDTAPTKIMTKLDFSVLRDILQPQLIA